MTSAGKCRSAGLTVVELVVAVALVAIVVSLAAPSFTRMIDMQRLRGTHDQIVTDLQFARSEAVQRGVPVHVRVQPQSAGAPSCYVVFTDTFRNFSPACDCHVLDSERHATCSSVNTKPLRTVVMVPARKVQLRSAGASDRVGFDPITGGVLLSIGDSGDPAPSTFWVESFLDATRKLQTRVELTGRPSTCAPAGSNIHLPPC